MRQRVNYLNVSNLLKVDIMLLSRLHRSGDLIKIERGAYDVTTLDTFLQAHSHNCGVSVPTWESISNGTHVLLKRNEVFARFDLVTSKLGSLVRGARVAYLKFPGKTGAVRYFEHSIRRLLQQTTIAMSYVRVAALLGLGSKQVINDLVTAGELEAVYNSSDPRRGYITQESFRRYLRRRLPPWVSAEDWIEDFDNSEHPLVASADAARALGISARFLKRTLEERKAWYIASPDGKNIRVSPLWLAGVADYEEPFSILRISQLYDVHRKEVYEWKQAGLLVCPITSHSHSEIGLSRACWRAVIKQDGSPCTWSQVNAFLATRSRPRPEPLLSLKEAANILGSRLGDVEAMVEDGKIFGVRTPTGRWRIIGNTIRNLKMS